MPIKKIPVDGGLVTSRDPSLLRENELSRADDCYYKPNDVAVWKVPGRTKFNSTVESGSIKGCRYLEFEGGTDLIITHVGTAYRKATANTTGTFSDVETGLSGGATLDSVHYNNEHFLLNGVDRNRVVESDGTARFHGMLESTEAPTLDASGAGGVSLSTGTTLTYWVEERVKDGDTIRRRSATISEDQTVTVTGLIFEKDVVVTRPAIKNSDATHWALYGTASNGSFPVGAEIDEVAIGTTSISDTRITPDDPGIPGGEAYQTVSVNLSGTSTIVAKNGQPPIANTGDVLEDSLVLNDSTDASRILYSFADEPDVFPAINFIRFETKEADEVRLIRGFGNYIVVCLRNSVWRVNTLPRPEDSAFQTERVKSQVQGAQGCVGPMAGDLFSMDSGIRLAYVSRYGIVTTDGFNWDYVTNDLDWENMVSISGLSNSVLVNNPRLSRLEFYYTPPNGSVNTKALYFNYHTSHLKVDTRDNRQRGFRPVVTGPISVSAASACVANINSADEVFTGKQDGFLYLESSGDTDTSGGTISMVLRTGDKYYNDIGGEFTARRVFVHHQAHPGQTATVRLISRVEGQDDHPREETIALDRREPTPIYDQPLCSALQIGVENSDTSGSIGIDYLAVEIEGQGPQTEE